MNLAGVDLNLLVVLQTVLTEGSTTRAAARLHVTQSAVSNSLARLRRLLGDRLLVRSAGRLVPTPRAAELRPLLTGGLEQLQAAIAGAREGNGNGRAEGSRWPAPISSRWLSFRAWWRRWGSACRTPRCG